MKDQFLNVRISEKTKLQLEKLAEISYLSKSAYIDRLISSTYYKYFDEKGVFKGDNKEVIFNSHV